MREKLAQLGLVYRNLPIDDGKQGDGKGKE